VGGHGGQLAEGLWVQDGGGNGVAEGGPCRAAGGEGRGSTGTGVSSRGRHDGVQRGPGLLVSE